MKHILIIEDERAVAELERDYLEINSLKYLLKKRVKADYKER